MTEGDEQLTNDADSWSAHFSKLITNAIYAGVLIGVGSFVAHLSRTHVIETETALLVGGAAFIAGGIYALIAGWHAIIAILWPALVFLGLAGAAAQSGAAAVKSIDEGGGLRSVVHRIWYGKNGPPS